jgi:hypothetical protein
VDEVTGVVVQGIDALLWFRVWFNHEKVFYISIRGSGKNILMLSRTEKRVRRLVLTTSHFPSRTLINQPGGIKVDFVLTNIPSRVLSYKLSNRSIHLLRMTKRQEMLPILHNLELRIRTTHKHLNLPLRISNRIYHVSSPVQPQHRTLDIRQSTMQPIPITEIDGCHSSPLPAFITNIVVCNLIAPELADGRVTVFAESYTDEEIGEFVAGAEGVVWGFAPGFNVGSQVLWCVPAA